MTYIIVTRNPGSGKLMVIEMYDEEGERQHVAEYLSEVGACHVADQIPICDAWGYKVVEIDI